MVAHSLYLIPPRIVTPATPLTSDELRDPLPVRAKYSSPIGRCTPFIHWRPHAVGAQRPLSAGAGLLKLESFVLSYAHFSEEALDEHPASRCLNVRATERLLLAAASILASVHIDPAATVSDVSMLITHHAARLPGMRHHCWIWKPSS